MTDAPKGPPPVTPKLKSKESLLNGGRATTTGGDPFNRARGNYSKKETTPKYDEDLGFGK